MQHQRQECAVLAEYGKDVGNLDLLGFLFLRGLGGGSHLQALLGEGVVQEHQHHADDAADDCGNAIAPGVVTESSDGQRNGDTAQQAGHSRAHAAGRGQSGALMVIGGHDAQQGTHGDVHHGVAQLIDDLQQEQGDDGAHAAQHTGNGVESDEADDHHGDRAENPGPELVGFVLCLGVRDVHQGAHQGVIDHIPDIPDQQKGCQNAGIDQQNVRDITVHVVGHHDHREHTTAVTAEVAELVFPGQLFRGCF